MKNVNKVAALGLALATGLMVVSAVFVPVVGAQTTNSTQAQINQLMAEINTLKASLGTSSSSSSSYNFTRNLTVGSKGADVGALQQILINGGYLTAVSAPTNYFGAATKSALAAWQKASGISPASGYFGPLTRAALAASGTTTGTTTGTGTTVVATGTGLTVSLASDSPVSGNVAIGAVSVPLLGLNFSAGSQPVTVNSLTVQRSGLSQDADLSNVYLYENGSRISTDQSISGGAITFSNSSGLFTVSAGMTQEISVTADIYNNAANSSNILVLSVPAASDVVTAGGAAVAGTFPVTGNQQSLVSVSNLATLTFQNVNSTTTINAGQNNNLVGQFTLTAGNNPVKVKSLRFTLTGSEPTQDLTNLYLSNGGVQEGATLSTLNGNIAQFSLDAAPLMLTSGQSATLQLYANVGGGIGDNFQFTVQQSSDIQAVDNMYNVGIGGTVYGNGSFPQNLYYVTVQPGGLVINSASSTALYAVQNNSNTVLGNFTVLASGDNIRLQTLVLTLNGSASTTNVQVLINGTQLGTTQTTMSTGNASAVTFSNLNYIIPANTTQTLTVQGTVSAGTSIGATLSITGQSQSNYVTVGPVQQSSPVLQVLGNSTNVSGYQNSAFGTPVLLAGTLSKVASFILQAGQVNSVLLNGVGISVPTNAVSSAGQLSNLYVDVNGTQIATAQGNVTAAGQYTFNAATPVVIPATQSVTVDVYASLSNAASSTAQVYLANLASVNATAGNNAVTVTAVNGENVTISQGQTLASVTQDPSTPSATVMGMGTSQNTLAAFRLNGSAQGPVTVTQLTVQDAASSSVATVNSNLGAFNNFTLVYGGSVLASQQSLNTSGTATGTATFVFSTPIVVAQNNYATIDLVGNAATYNSGSVADATTHAFQVTSYVANLTTGATTTSVTPTGASGNNITLYRTMPSSITAGTVSPVTSSVGVGNIDSAFQVGAGSGGDVYLQGLTWQPSGSVVNTASTTLTFQLIDAANPSVILATATSSLGAATTTYLNGATSTSLGNVGWDVPAGSVHTLQFKVVSGSNTNSATNNNGTFQISISKVIWGDGTASSTSGSLTFLPSTISLPIPGPFLSSLSN